MSTTPPYEKDTVPIPDAEVENAGSSDVVDEKTERKLMRKLDLRIIPMVMWIYLMNFMDRVNIGNARLYGFEEELNLTGDQYQIAVSILFVTYCLFEAPSNLIIKRLQPARYLAGLTIAWGLVATFTAFVNSFASLVVCRLLLGFFEAGLFPGVILYLTMFYNKKNIALRNAYFFATAAISGAAGGLVAYGIGFMDGAGGWRAWRWIILINGIPTILTGLVVPFVLPNDPQTAKFLTETDRRNMILLREAEIGQTKSAQVLHKEDVMKGVKDWKVWVYPICQYCSNTMLYSFSIFLPTIIQQIGTWSTAEVQCLTIPVYVTGAIVYIAAARVSDITQHRGLFCMGATATSIFGYCLLIANVNSQMSFAGCFFVAAGCYTATGTALAWLSSNCPRYGKRAIAGGLQLTVGNSAGVAAPFLFQSIYAPTYFPGYGATIGLLSLSFSLFTTMHFYFKRQNSKRLAGLEDWKMEGKTDEQVAEMGDDSPKFMYTI
ncbi:hypothetical protein PV10_03441 [Exophiala mesophila]|uniref:Major facilitator superfamily (MFS) profile domain-containing protein n=1 Tax=Exophiala mesophila TaxID=212818 RepID=A0A0D1X225_EXOME|nr:uncharacterized protein PV10_03441 [Exophiala mesophila]KIV95835.1 hypothetical protein PV10_03441 [Exophiala mesophila]